MPDDDKKTGGVISGFGFSIVNLPRPVHVALSVLVVVGVLGGIWWKTIRQPEYEATLERQARLLLQASVEEYGKHIAETPESTAIMVNDQRERKIVQNYADGCMIVARTRNGRTRTKLILDIDFEQVPKAGTMLEGVVDGVTTIVSAVLEAQGRCLNPHPPNPGDPRFPFQTWYGERRECWVEVWRRWNDGCTHVQWYDSCHNVWASNPDGSPAVRWTSCVH